MGGFISGLLGGYAEGKTDSLKKEKDREHELLRGRISQLSQMAQDYHDQGDQESYLKTMNMIDETAAGNAFQQKPKSGGKAQEPGPLGAIAGLVGHIGNVLKPGVDRRQLQPLDSDLVRGSIQSPEQRAITAAKSRVAGASVETPALADIQRKQDENDRQIKLQHLEEANTQGLLSANEYKRQKAQLIAGVPLPPTPKPSNAAEARNNLIEDHKNLLRYDPAWASKSEDEITKEATRRVAAADIKIKEKQGTFAPKTNDEDKYTQAFLHSGKAIDEATARKMASDLVLKVADAKIKAAAGSGVMLNPIELGALADSELTGGPAPKFGLGKGDPNRMLYYKTLAGKLTGEGALGDAIATKADVASTRFALTKMVGMKSQIGAFEDTAKKNIQVAIALSNQLGRSGSSLVNEYQLYLQGKLEDYPLLASFRVAIQTAANEYAKVVSNATGGAVTSDSARKEGHDIFNAAMAKGSLTGAGEQMYVDMHNRISSIDDVISGLKDGLRSTKIGGGSGGEAGKPRAKDPLGVR